MALPEGMSACSMCVEIMTGGTVFVDASDELGVVTAPGMPRSTAEAYVFGEDIAVLGYGKRGPGDVVIRGVYTDSTASFFYKANQAFTTACGALFAVRWSPGGCTTAHRSFRTSTTVTKITSLTGPSGDAGSADVLMWEATVRTPEVTEATWA